MHAKWIPIVPNTFRVPREYSTGNWFFSPLTMEDIEDDYLAITESSKRLKGTFDFVPDWPERKNTKNDDLAFLGWHQTEFELRTSFAYVIHKLTGSKKEYVGCGYIFPSTNSSFEVDIYLWVKNGFESSDKILFQIFREWIERAWTFNKIRFPGRS